MEHNTVPFITLRKNTPPLSSESNEGYRVVFHALPGDWWIFNPHCGMPPASSSNRSRPQAPRWDAPPCGACTSRRSPGSEARRGGHPPKGGRLLGAAGDSLQQGAPTRAVPATPRCGAYTGRRPPDSWKSAGLTRRRAGGSPAGRATHTRMCGLPALGVVWDYILPLNRIVTDAPGRKTAKKSTPAGEIEGCGQPSTPQHEAASGKTIRFPSRGLGFAFVSWA